MFDFETELRNLPEKPGVYIMKNNKDEVIYVGKAKILKNRVRQYFQKNSSHTPKVLKMVENIASFSYIVTDTELEALVLECTLIKKHKPKYNIRLKDDKNYPFIKITTNEAYPRAFVARTLKSDKAKYFGPYSSGMAVRETLNLIKKTFALRSCSKNFPRDIGKTRPCLNYHIGRCVAPCTGAVSEDEYNELVKGVISFLEGKYDNLLSELKIKMKEASDNLEFEKAAACRDKINAIQKISQKQKIVRDADDEKDIIAFAVSEQYASFHIFYVRDGKIKSGDNFIVEGAGDETNTQILTEFLNQFYSEASFVPKEILVQYNIEEDSILYSLLKEKRGSKVNIRVPVRGDMAKLLYMAENNAAQNLQRVESQNKSVLSVLDELKNTLALSAVPKRIEMYDISNISGASCVASMVVFTNGKADKKEYRRFKVNNEGFGGDYGAMSEVIFRRLTHGAEEIRQIESGELEASKAKFAKFPDLILLDGGKGHVGTIRPIIKEFNLNTPVFGLVKDNKHRTRAIVGEKEEMSVNLNGSLYRFLYSMQEEVHKQAISYHRKTRDNKNLSSELSNIKGVGEATIRKLQSTFSSPEEIKKLSAKEISERAGINKNTAENIEKYFL